MKRSAKEENQGTMALDSGKCEMENCSRPHMVCAHVCVCVFMARYPPQVTMWLDSLLKEVSNGGLMGHVSTSQMVAKAEEFLKQKGHLFHPYRQIFNILIALLGCIFFLWAVLGVLFNLISPEWNCFIRIALMNSQQLKTGNEWKEKMLWWCS